MRSALRESANEEAVKEDSRKTMGYVTGSEHGPEPSGGGRSGLPVDPLRILRAFAAARWWFLAAVVLGSVAGIVAGKALVPRVYQATAVLVYEGLPELEGVPRSGQVNLRTLLDSVKLPSNLVKVAERFGGSSSVAGVAGRIDVENARGSDVVAISGVGVSPAEAKVFTEAVVDVYLDFRRRVEGERIGEVLASTRRSLELARAEASEKRLVYDTFRANHGVADLDAERALAIEAASDLRTAADLARAEVRAQGVRRQQLEQEIRRQATTAIISQRVTSPDEQSLAKVRTDLAVARAQLADDHPRVEALAEQESVLVERVASGDNRVTSKLLGLNPHYQATQEMITGVTAEREAARERESTLRSISEAAKNRVVQLAEIEGEARRLGSAVEAAERHQTRLEELEALLTDAARAPMTGFRLVAQPQAPHNPESTNLPKLIALAAPLFALSLVVFAVLVKALWGARVWTVLELAFWTRSPVVGMTSWPRGREEQAADALHELVHGLDDVMPSLTGETLVVPWSERDGDAVAALARELMLRSLVMGTRGGAPANFEPWVKTTTGAGIRRAARRADRVLLVVPAGEVSASSLFGVRQRLGRENHLVFILSNLSEEHATGPDRAGVKLELLAAEV